MMFDYKTCGHALHSIRNMMLQFPSPTQLIPALLILGARLVSAEIDFNRDVRPILSDRCFACHGFDAHDRKGHIRLDVADGEDGAYRTRKGWTGIKPGDLKKSEVWLRIISDDEEEIMPPPESHKKPLNEEEQAIIKQWILEGAKYDDFWAFVPPDKPVMPKVKQDNWSEQAIDQFTLKRMEEEGLKPSKEADKRTLIRRATFDLTGLPPTREEIAAFLGNRSADAYEKLVDELISRPQYGEHMARYWLDLVRFADTNGMHKDFYRNNVLYRDWVIRSFNDNLGYDDFLRYQLAGDQIPEGGNDALVASGFNRLHLIIDRGTALPEESHFKNVLDRVTAVGTAFMGLTVQCAQCHDHKYDPITQKDFFSMYAFFNNDEAEPETRGRQRTGLQPPFIEIPTDAQKDELAKLDAKLAELNRQIAALKNEKKTLKPIEDEVAKVKKQRDAIANAVPKAMIMREREEIRPAHLRIRGAYDAIGDVVPRATPDFLPPLQTAGEVPSRLDLANWFVDPKHPLTARVQVNRLWQQFFGVGLVKTSEDLGAQGEVPSHPQLLDLLATNYVESGWDTKALVKSIVMSQTYRQASASARQDFASDPENRLLARGSRYRMDAEMVRDQILATSGQLSSQMYGPSVKPPQPPGLWKAVSMTGQVFKADSGESIRRRSIYTFWKRAMPPPQMTIMNAPIRDACISRRERTNTPTQALLMLNESQYLLASRALAQKVLALEGIDQSMRIEAAYEIVTSKLPDADEVSTFATLIADLEKDYGAKPELADAMCNGVQVTDAKSKARLASWTMFVSTLYNLDITKTRE